MENNSILSSSIIRHAIQGEEINAVDARMLHAFLEVGNDFSTWIKRRIEVYGFTQGIDYVTFENLRSPNMGSTKARPQVAIEYALTIDMAKELSMVENNEKGREARRHFIEMEKKAKELVLLLPNSMPEALRALAQYHEDLERKDAELRSLAPKAVFHDRVTSAINAQSINEVAKVLGTGQNRFFKWLRDMKILMKGNRPYQEHIDSGKLRLVEGSFIDGRGESRTYTKTLVTGKGLTWLQQLWDESRAA